MKYCVSTPNRGWKLKPNRTWDGKKGFLFRIRGKSDSDYATCPTTRKSVSGYGVFLEGAPITVKRLMQRIIALSVTEAETISGVACVQEMLYAMKILLSFGLLVELPMILEIDNKGAVDMANNWSGQDQAHGCQVSLAQRAQRTRTCEGDLDEWRINRC